MGITLVTVAELKKGGKNKTGMDVRQAWTTLKFYFYVAAAVRSHQLAASRSLQGAFLGCLERVMSAPQSLSKPNQRLTSLPVTSAAVDQPAAPTTTPAEDPRDALIANLMATLQAVIQYLPEGHPLRAPCLQATGAQPGAPGSE